MAMLLILKNIDIKKKPPVWKDKLGLVITSLLVITYHVSIWQSFFLIQDSSVYYSYGILDY